MTLPAHKNSNDKPRPIPKMSARNVTANIDFRKGLAMSDNTNAEQFISADAVYLKYADEYRTLLDSIRRSFVGKTVRLENYHAGINGRIGKITDVRLVDGKACGFTWMAEDSVSSLSI